MQPEAGGRWRAVARKLHELFAIDGRTLALFRVGLGLMLLADLVKRSWTLEEHYTRLGVFPRRAAAQIEPSVPLFDVYMLSDRYEVQAALFLLAGALAVLLIVGWRTRLVTFLSLVMLAALQRRNPFACHTGDILLLVLVTWSLFLPLGSYWSLDRLRNPGRPAPPRQVLSVGTVAVLAQLVMFYVGAGILKHQQPIWVEGRALDVFLRIEEYTRPLGASLIAYPRIGTFVTYFTMVLEGLGPLLFFSPVFTPKLRFLAFLLFCGFHLGIQFSIYIGIFEIVSIVAVALVLPPWFWDELLPRVPVPRALRAAAASVSAAWVRVFAPRSRATPPAAAPSRLARAGHAGLQALCALCLCVMLASNVAKFEGQEVPLPAGVMVYARQVGLIQNWNIFSAIGKFFVGWYLVLGQTEDGRIVEVQAGREFTGVRPPELVARTFPNHNMRRFWVLMAQDNNRWLRPYLARWLARRWNEEHDAKLVRLTIFHVGNVAGSGDPERLKPLHEYRAAPADGAPELAPEREAELAEAWEGFLSGLPPTVP